VSRCARAALRSDCSLVSPGIFLNSLRAMHNELRPAWDEKPITGSQKAEREQRWLWLGYVLTALLLLFRLGYIASGVIELSNDEAYQWLWSKHLALSYYSKPPAIAFIQFAGTALWGDTELGVRFFSPKLPRITETDRNLLFARPPVLSAARVSRGLTISKGHQDPPVPSTLLARKAGEKETMSQLTKLRTDPFRANGNTCANFPSTPTALRLARPQN